MANEKTNAVNTVNGATENVTQVYNVKVAKAMLPPDTDSRISLTTDSTFPVVDFTTGEIKDTNIIGFNTYNLVSQLVEVGGCDYVELADALCMGTPINPQIVSLSLYGAEMKIQRIFHHAGEEREYEGVYEKDCYTTKIVAIKLHIKPLFEKKIMWLIEHQPSMVKKVQNVETDLTSLNI